MPWGKLCLYVYKLGHHVTPVRPNGFCFLHAVEMVLYMDHDEVVTLDSMESTILGHLAANVKYYQLFHTGDVLKDAERYFKFGIYCDNVFNPIVVATARALKLNLMLYQKGLEGNIQIFVPDGGARHRSAKTGIEGTFMPFMQKKQKKAAVDKNACRSGKVIKGSQS